MKPIKDTLPSHWTKTILYGVFLLVLILGYIFLPKQLMNQVQIYDIAVSSVSTADDNLVAYDIKVYGTQKRFDEGLTSDVALKVEEAKAQNQVLVVKIPGKIAKTENKGEYHILVDNAVPELNIEYYFARSVNLGSIVLPTNTFLTLGADMLPKVNTIYLVTVSIIALGLAIPPSIGLARHIPEVVRFTKAKKEEA